MELLRTAQYPPKIRALETKIERLRRRCLEGGELDRSIRGHTIRMLEQRVGELRATREMVDHAVRVYLPQMRQEAYESSVYKDDPYHQERFRLRMIEIERLKHLEPPVTQQQSQEWADL